MSLGGTKAGYTSDKITAFSAPRHFPGRLSAPERWRETKTVSVSTISAKSRALAFDVVKPPRRGRVRRRSCRSMLRCSASISAVLCPLNAGGLIPLRDSRCAGENRPPAAISWGIFHKFQLRAMIPPPHRCCGGCRGSRAPLIVPESLYAHVDRKPDID